MPHRAKRFYLCNLIPLWEVDEPDMDVDWPVYHGYFGDLIDMKADIFKRPIRWHIDGDSTKPSPDLKVRFEVYESDFLLTGGLDDHMGTYSSDAGYGDKPEVRPLKIVADVDNVPEADKEKFIFIQWQDATDVTVQGTDSSGKPTSEVKHQPAGLRVRAFWKITDQPGGDVSGNPEYYYDVYVDGKLEDAKDLSLHERADNELEGWNWNVTSKARKGRVTPLVDGEYAFLEMLRLLDGAQHTIHILNWKFDPLTTLALTPRFEAEYSQVPGLDEADYEAMLVRCKPRTLGVSVKDGVLLYSASNGNVVAAKADGTGIEPAIQQIDQPTNLELPSGIALLDSGAGGNFFALVLDQLRSRLLLYVVIGRSQARLRGPGVYSLAFPGRGLPFFQSTPTLGIVMTHPDLIAGVIPLAGNGLTEKSPGQLAPPDAHPGYLDGGLVNVGDNNMAPLGKMNHPTGIVVVAKTIYITDTDNHCIRRIKNFDPADLGTTLGSSDFNLETLSGTPTAGNTDGTASTARFDGPTGIAFDSTAGRLLVADTGNKKIRAVNPASGTVSTLAINQIDGAAGSLGEVRGLAFDPGSGGAGVLYVSERDRHRILAVNLDTLAATTLAGSTAGNFGYHDDHDVNARFHHPLDLAIEAGKLFVADSDNHVIRAIDLGTRFVTTIGSESVAGPQDVPVLVADVMARKAREGVTVRLLMDGYGSGVAHDEVSPTVGFEVDGPQTADDLLFYERSIEVYVNNHPASAFGHVEASYHDKMMVVDGKHGTIGGIDFAPDKNDGVYHERFHRASLLWHDVVAFVEGPAVLGLEEHFVRRWGMARDEYEGKPKRPEALQAVDGSDATINDGEAETVRTFDPTPLIGLLPHLIHDEVKEILESYRRAILSARDYIYLEHQYIFYPELGDYTVQAMKDNPRLQVIWMIPFFTEESQDPSSERAKLLVDHKLATSISDFGKLFEGGQLQKQMAWHGFFRHHEMVERFRKVDAKRFGLFSIQRPFPSWQEPSEVEMKMIYPHSKLMVCDDRFLSVGSANANGRGFLKDGEVNVSALAPSGARALRMRLWGEHLGYGGVAVLQADGSLAMLNGHHLEHGSKVFLRHKLLGASEVEREVDSVDATHGTVLLTGPALDPAMQGQRIAWRDPILDHMPLLSALDFWRRSAHPLDVFRVVQGSHATTNAAGELVVPGHVAKAGDGVEFGAHLLLLNDDGSAAKSAPVPRPMVAGALKVDTVTGDRIVLAPRTLTIPDVGDIHNIPTGGTVNQEPFIIKVVSRASGKADLELRLLPNLKDVHFNYTTSWLLRQPGFRQLLRTWEIDPPEGIEYGGPGTIIFNPWLIIPWFFIDFNPDEQSRLDLPQGETRLV